MRVMLPLLCLWGCATGGDPSVGGTALPNPGYAPYTVYAEGDAGLTPVLEDRPGSEPMAYVAEGRLTLIFSECPTNGPCRIMTTTSADGITFTAPELLAEREAGLTDPYIERIDGRRVLWAVSDGGSTLVQAELQAGTVGPFSVTLDTGPFASPSVVNGPAGRLLFFVRAGQLFRARAEGEGWTTPEPVIGPCATEACWPRAGVADVEVRGSTTSTGRRHYRATILDAEDGAPQVGFAVSADGRDWSFVTFNPTVDLGRGAFDGVSNLRFDDDYLLYFTRGRAMPRIGLAINSAGRPSVEF